MRHLASSTLLALFFFSACSAKAPQGRPPKPGDAALHADPHAEHHGPELTLAGLSEGAMLLPDLGTWHREASTESDDAQAYFDQGLRLSYAFNHDEAARSFAKAAALDPSCAICFWGVTYTLGPNYNFPMMPGRAKAAREAIERAQAEGTKATEVERALVRAMALRHPDAEEVAPEAMQPRVEAYAAAMDEVAKRFPDDPDVQAIAAEAAMNVNPWKLWTPDGKPAEGTEAIVARLEGVLATVPEHPGANHFYIHAVEASLRPDRAIPSADRLGTAIPGAGHIVHMPAHIYQRVGRYADASEANRRAIEADRRYLETMEPIGYYPFYYSHNFGFLAYSASMEGRGAEAIEAARKATEQVPMDVVCGMPGMDFFLSEPLLVMVRFGMWDELLATPAPDPKYAALSGLWHHAHGMALAATGKPKEARADLEQLKKIAAEVPEDMLTGLNAGTLVLQLAATALDARIAEAEKRPDAIALWEKAVALEDQLAYNEPADWFYPVRHYLGSALLDAGRAKDAEAVFRQDLRNNPANGWALFGVWKALQGQKKAKEAARAEKEFQAAWARADTPLVRAAF